MLSRLTVSNYALIQALELEFSPNLSVLTGETGAGKSILLGALGLALGERADSSAVREKCARADVSAFFTGVGAAASAWLTERDLDGGVECQLRRVVLADGGSRAYVNGTPLPVSQLRELGALLVEIHGQRDNQHLSSRIAQRRAVDRFGRHESQLHELASLTATHAQIADRLAELVAAGADASQLEFLRFQLNEFDGLELDQNAIADLERKHRTQANAEQLLAACEAARVALEEDRGAVARLAEARRELASAKGDATTFASVVELLDSAVIQVQEAAQELSHLGSDLTLDPAAFAELEQRLAVLHDLARKHRVGATELGEFRDQLRQRLQDLSGREDAMRELQEAADERLAAWKKVASKLTRDRDKTGKKLSRNVNILLKELSMPDAAVTVGVNKKADPGPFAEGADDVSLLVATNPGQKPQPIGKIASGGELARISLALKVATTADEAATTLIFDEVDAGVGGATAEVVGRLLRDVAEHHQVLTVTHLPQVAAQAAYHYQVEKGAQGKKSAQTRVESLTTKQREQEIARMLGGVEITKKTLEHAKDMLRRARAA